MRRAKNITNGEKKYRKSDKNRNVKLKVDVDCTLKKKKKKNVQLNLICLQRQMAFYSVSKLISIQLSHLVLIFFSN